MTESIVMESEENEAKTVPQIMIPTSEQEIPPVPIRGRSSITENLSPQEVDLLEKENRAKKVAQEIHLKDNAFVLLCGCLLAFVLLYFVDTFVINMGGKTSEVLPQALDMAKTVVTFLIGYLFASEKNQH